MNLLKNEVFISYTSLKQLNDQPIKRRKLFRKLKRENNRD
ncbi:hypothetical protein STACA0001_2149 [Staphylococcus capitis SK14]|nr:hypothetical protein STACA0001_2149 [Staphylococcus capitis SK14]